MNRKEKILFGIKAVMISLFILGLLIVLIGFAVLFKIIKDAPTINPQNIESLLNESSFIYDSSGVVIEKIQSNQYRTIVPVEQMPEDLLNAFIAIEDERFMEHNGIDYKRLIGVTIMGLQDGHFSQGASTITMQLSKNLYTSPEATITRKVTDMYYALEMEKQLSKTQILKAYLNTIFLGGDANGVQAAAKSYFNKDVSKLNLAECAMIAGITQYPSRYIPFRTEDITTEDDLSTLEIKLYPTTDKEPTAEEFAIYQSLRDYGLIDGYEFILLKKGNLYAQKAVLNEKSVDRQRTVLAKMLELGKITSAEYQEALETPIIIDFPPRANVGISSYFSDVVKSEVVDILVKMGNSEEKATDMLRNGGLKIYSTMNTKIQKILESEFSNEKNFPSTYLDEDGIIQPQGSMVIIDQNTGHVVALIGGREQAGSMIFNRALSPRQPGSSIKPLAVYMPALERGLTPTTLLKDEPRVDKTSPTGYWPKNLGSVYRGNMTATAALGYSSNVIAVGLMENLASTRAESINIALRNLENCGITTLVRSSDNPRVNDENLSLALGGMAKGVSPLEMAASYTCISELGTMTIPTFVMKIEDSNGQVLYEFEPMRKKITNENVAYDLTGMMVSTIDSYTSSAKLNNSIAGGKTGTTSDDKDYWFVGFTPYYTAATWIGTDTPTEMYGTSWIAASLWKKVMDRVHEDLPRISFDTPKEKREIIQEPMAIDSPEEETSVTPDENENMENILFEEPGIGEPVQEETVAPTPQEPFQPAEEQVPSTDLPPDMTQPANPVIEDIPPETPPPEYEDVPPAEEQTSPTEENPAI